MPSSNKTPYLRRQFASDNNSGICPEVWASLKEANSGHAFSYGDDPWTDKAAKLIRNLFKTDCEVFFVFNGTASNSLALASICNPFHSMICHQHAHIATDECGAPGFFSHGATQMLAAGENGKLTPNIIEHLVRQRNDVHISKPRAVSLSQATELGTVYSPRELAAIGKKAQELDLHFHMDGARFANAVAELKVKPQKITWEVGVDILCLGGTKNGMALGEAVVFFNHDLAQDFDRRCKQSGQLGSKMRFLAAQWIGLLQDGTWLRNATQANRIASLLEKELQSISNLQIAFPRQANSVFIKMPLSLIDSLRKRGWHFYTDITPDIARFVCSWDSTKGDVEILIRDIRSLLK